MTKRDFIIEYVLRAVTGTGSERTLPKPVDLIFEAQEMWNEIESIEGGPTPKPKAKKEPQDA